MKTQLIIITLFTLILASCKKDAGWETRLNGKWEEFTNNNSRALPSNCFIEFQDGIMIICNESIGKDLNQKSDVFAKEGQVWISYKLSFRKHQEYRYDYQFEGEYLWIMEETTANKNTVINHPAAKKYRKL